MGNAAGVLPLTTLAAEITSLPPPPTSVASLPPFPKHGIRASYFKKFIEEHEGKEITFSGKTTTEVCELLVKPLTFQSQISYCEMLLSQNDPNVGLATVFISHAWKYQFLTVVEAILQHLERQGIDPNSIVIWFDLFSNNQHKAVEFPFEWWCNTFQSAIKEFNHTIMVLSPWNDPIPLTRAWCIWELYSTIITKSKFEIAMSRKDRLQFLEDVRQDWNQVINLMLSKVNSERSEAWKKEDQDRIHEAVRKTLGFHAMNGLIFKRMREWVIWAVQESLKEKEAELRTNPDPNQDHVLIELQFILGSLYSGQGNYTKAEELYRLTQKKVIELCGADSIEAINAQSQLNSLYVLQGKYGQAEQALFESIPKELAAFGPSNSKPLTSLHNLGLAYHHQGKLQEAESTYQVCYERRKEYLGPEDPATLTTMNNLANLYQERKNYLQAEKLYRDCYDIMKKKYGENHPRCLSLISNIATLYDSQGKLEESLQLFEVCLSKSRSILGNHHPDTIATMNNLANLHQRQGQYDLAETLYREALISKYQRLGEDHPDTLQGIYQLVCIYEKMKRNESERQWLLGECYERALKILGKEHPFTKLVEEKAGRTIPPSNTAPTPTVANGPPMIAPPK
jgi:tetratricopeptide (TPR) repeat protein